MYIFYLNLGIVLAALIRGICAVKAVKFLTAPKISREAVLSGNLESLPSGLPKST